MMFGVLECNFCCLSYKVLAESSNYEEMLTLQKEKEVEAEDSSLDLDYFIVVIEEEK